MSYLHNKCVTVIQKSRWGNERARCGDLDEIITGIGIRKETVLSGPRICRRPRLIFHSAPVHTTIVIINHKKPFSLQLPNILASLYPFRGGIFIFHKILENKCVKMAIFYTSRNVYLFFGKHCVNFFSWHNVEISCAIYMKHLHAFIFRSFTTNIGVSTHLEISASVSGTGPENVHFTVQ